MQTLHDYILNNSSRDKLIPYNVTDYIRKHTFPINSKHVSFSISDNNRYDPAIQLIKELQSIKPTINGIIIECLLSIVFSFENEIYKEFIESSCRESHYENVNGNINNNDEPLVIVYNMIYNEIQEQFDDLKDDLKEIFKDLDSYTSFIGFINNTIYSSFTNKSISPLLLFYISYYVQQHLACFRENIDPIVMMQFIKHFLNNWDKMYLLFEYLNELNLKFESWGQPIKTLKFNYGCGGLVNKNNILFKATIDMLINNHIIVDIKCCKKDMFTVYARQLNLYQQCVEYYNSKSETNDYKHEDYQMYVINVLQNKIYKFELSDFDMNDLNA